MKRLLKLPIVWILFGWNIILLYAILVVLYKGIRWSLGYWQCYHCKKVYWMNKPFKTLFTPSKEYVAKVCHPCFDIESKRMITVEKMFIKNVPKTGSSVKKEMNQ